MSGMAWSDDLLDRKVRADFLSNYLDEDICRVLNLDSPWGAGKTYFLTNWRFQLLSEKTRPVVYFNAWENDFLPTNSHILFALFTEMGLHPNAILKDFLTRLLNWIIHSLTIGL